MSTPLQVAISGIGAFLPGAPDWPSLRGALRGEHGLRDDAPARPAANVLPAAERRRAPDSVRLAAEVASQACQMAACDPATLPCIFASTQGEVAITDYVCETLATAPDELSPTKFHNSVLNAPAGYWTIATGCTAASSAVSGYHNSFAAGLLEAAVLACAEATPVLFACCDVAASGPLQEMIGTRHAFGAALVLAPATTGIRLKLNPRTGTIAQPTPPAVALQAAASDNPANAQALALLAALAGEHPTRVGLALSTGMYLDMEITA